MMGKSGCAIVIPETMAKEKLLYSLKEKGALCMNVLKMKYRRIIALMLCLCLLLALAGCGEQDQPESTGSGDTAGTSPSDAPTENTPVTKEPANVTVLTLNVAYYDGIYTDDQHLVSLAYPNQTKEEDYTFAERADRLRVLLKHYAPDVFFLNEFNFAWWEEVISGDDAILKELTQYTFVESRSTGSSKNGEGEKYLDLYNMVFFDQERFILLDSGSFVTCQTWSGWYDHCTWAKLRDKETGQEAVYAAIHVQTVPTTQRAVLSLQATTKAVETLSEVAAGVPIILGGDFNTTETSTGHYTYEYMVNQAGFKDCRYAAPQTDASGTARIWGKTMTNNGNRIDYIFVNGAGVKSYQVASGAFLADDTYVEEISEADLKTGNYYDISDHLPVVATVILKGAQSAQPEDYRNTVGDADIPANPTGSFTENGGTALKLTFDFADALNYVGNVNQQGFEASLVQDETYGTVLKLQASEHIVAGYISIDYGALMEACGLTPVDAKEYSKVKITYLANTSYTSDGGILKFGVLREGVMYPSGTNSLGITTYDKWTTQTLYFSALSGEVYGPVKALNLYNADGALQGDAIYIASIEFVK